MPNGRPTFWLIAGPNGIGKTTFARARLEAISGSVNFVNMDEIARGLSPLRPSVAERDAAEVALERARRFIAARTTFAMETTLSGRAHLRLVETAKLSGMETALMFFAAADPRICLERIARRVAEGGHDVDRDVALRRFGRGASNFSLYAAAVDLWRLYDASGAKPVLAAEGVTARLAFADPDILARLPNVRLPSA
ncbi:AAA family ATPase [Chelatococcus sambhunathii]|uniref:AAA family ATPase n=1 Tax=Chelatococcus sambhunathii TaxID=363953 RepID=A0ABU1DH28_9HYPH|nr:AAA family ATPase [Chelatococcus sambhunathii]MDR4307345.1 AAA family ATPase [Chelatococcus sambhunathii]